MFLQLISHNSNFLINLLIVCVGRFLDILSTYYVTAKLKLETNKLARKIGWKGMILVQIPILILGSLDFYLALFIFLWSLYLFANNLESSWYIRDKGEDQYYNDLKDILRRTSIRKIIIGEISLIFSFSVSGVLMLILVFIFEDYIAAFFIGLAMICHGLLGSYRSLRYLLSLRKEALTAKTSETV